MVNVYFDALKKAGGDPTNHEAVAKAIGETDKVAAEGRIQFDPKTHLSVQGDENVPLLFFQIWKGERVLIQPDKYSTGEFQLPPWMKK